ncbi:MAG TPA: hydrogenase 4 subunit B [Burkholderiales bacterium]|jgi:formate hydrogenlyase subunit 3/multisubunit Na+/H+ antiporter MnhD subunit|nr:hydrogenase 4 subunit B [Burkholderiales bacterium]
MNVAPLDAALLAAATWVAIGLGGMLAPRHLGLSTRVLYPAGALVGLALAAIALEALFAAPAARILPLGLPDLPFHARLDALSAFFLLILGAVSAGVSVFASGYLRAGEATPPGLQCLCYHLFLASMAFVLLADDAYFFMVAWETMALSSFFLVTTEHRDAVIRRAGYLYLLIAHLGAISILLCFGALQGGSGDYTFETMRTIEQPAAWASAAFLLALIGFGAKAGIVPLHVWLPEAHPAAPSPVSALMSAVMLKTAVYGLLRVTLDLIGFPLWWWGVVVLAVGLVSALFGIVFAAVQTDMKRLLAYSSIENIGFIMAGFGLTLLFRGFGMGALAALALTATLYHCLNHAFYKSLLFLATGSVLHATSERSLGRLGGLIHRMPWVAWCALIGTIAIAGLPPLNGFVSEWLLLQAFLFTPGLPQAYLNMLVPVAAAVVALAAALSGYVMVKFFGVVFLGQPREAKLANAHDADRWQRTGLAWLAAGCIALGLVPATVIGMLDPITRGFTGYGMASLARGWLYLAPIEPQRASYSPLLFFAVATLLILIAWLSVRFFYHGRARRSRAWDCGFPYLDSRMQDTAEGFGQPVRQVFQPAFRVSTQAPSPLDRRPRYGETVEDRLWYWLYLPVARAVEKVTALVTVLQRGRISVYLTYSFATLLVLLFFIR